MRKKEMGEMDHIAYCDKKAKELEKLFNGSKSMLIRGAAGRKIPYGRVNEGEKVYLVENDGSCEIKASALVKSVFNSEKMTKEESEKLIQENMDKLNLTNAQLKRWNGKRYICLIEISDIKEIEPFTFKRTSNMDDWLIIEKIDEVKE